MKKFSLLLAFLFLFFSPSIQAKQKKTPAPPPQPLPPENKETRKWNYYRNTAQGFYIKYPTTMQIYEEDFPVAKVGNGNDYRGWTYLPPQIKSALRVGFSPIIRDSFSTVIEIYITEEVPKFIHLDPTEFLGAPRIASEEPSAPLAANGLKFKEIDVAGDNEPIHNAYLIVNNRVYLFVTRHPSPETMKIMNEMLSTVRISALH